MFGLQTLFDPMTLIILGALVLCLVLWGIFAARRKPVLVATMREDPPVATTVAPDSTVVMAPTVLRPATSLPVEPAPVAETPVTGSAPGPFPLPATEHPLQDSRLVAPTEVVVVWRAVSQAVEEFAVRIDTVSRDQLVFGGLARNSQAPVENARLERRLFHTMVLPNESMLSIRTRAGSPIHNVRAWLRELPDAV